jgi:hypothetical protein
MAVWAILWCSHSGVAMGSPGRRGCFRTIGELSASVREGHGRQSIGFWTDWTTSPSTSGSGLLNRHGG